MTADNVPSNPTAAKAEPCQLVLVKKGQRWVFRYTPGEEQQLLRWLVDTARDPGKDFSWFDAAVLSHQMAGKFQQQLKQMMFE